MEWLTRDDLPLIADSARRLCRTLQRRPMNANGAASLAQAWGEAAEHGFLPTAVDEALPDDAARVTLVRYTAEGSVALAVSLAAHGAALAALAELPAAEAPAARALLAAGRNGHGAPLIGLAYTTAIGHEDRPGTPLRLAPIDPVRCRLLVVLDADGITLTDATAAATGARRAPALLVDELPAAWVRLPPDPVGVHLTAAAPEAAARARSRFLLGLAAAQLGNSAAALAIAERYAQERRQTGRLLIDHQNVRVTLVTLHVWQNAAESFLFRAAVDRDRFSGPFDLCRQAFRFAAEAGEMICLDAMQVLGGYGYMHEYGIESRLRACKAVTALASDQLSGALGIDPFAPPPH
jgi:alkylation response protein AidB-like acyl-CoA dehydrogenase